jgi:hypothetical protein
MKIESRFIAATLMATAAFVMTGGLHATEQAVAAEEGKAIVAQETSIPFANMGGIRDWRAIDDSSLYVQDIRRNWYIARLAVPSPDLAFVQSIGFETKGTNQLDKFAALVVGGQRIPLTSFVASAPPPPKAKAGATAGK